MPYATTNPYTNEVVKTFPTATDAEVDAALDRAWAAFPAWRDTPVAERAAIFRRAAEIFRERTDELGALATLEMGKLAGEANMEGAHMAAPILDWCADAAPGILAPRLAENTGVDNDIWLTYRAQGIVYEIEPWNVPFYQAIRGFAPAAISGNVVILKHASNVPQCAQAAVDILHEAGLPEGVWQNVYASHDQSARIVADRRVRAVTLTGSAEVGARVAAQAGAVLKPSVMELGGSDAFIVLPDADLDAAVDGSLFRFFIGGQVCVSPKRMIVAENLHDEFVAKLSACMAGLTGGDPTDPATTLAPLSSQGQADTVKAQIAAAVAAGATAITPGEPVPGAGAFVQPTILTGVTKDNPAFYDEIFGPVPIIFSVKDADEAVALANDSHYGLAGAVFGGDVDNAYAVADQLDTGNVNVNTARSTGASQVPFGGVKDSGFGRELGPEGIHAFTNVRPVTLVPGEHLTQTPTV